MRKATKGEVEMRCLDGQSFDSGAGKGTDTGSSSHTTPLEGFQGISSWTLKSHDVV